MGKKSKKNQQKKEEKQSSSEKSKQIVTLGPQSESSKLETELNAAQPNKTPPSSEAEEKKTQENENENEHSKYTDSQDNTHLDTDDDLEDEPIVEREPSSKSLHHQNGESNEYQDDASKHQHHEERIQQDPTQTEEEQGWFNSSWASWISDSTSRAMKTVQSQSNNLGKSIQTFVKEEVVGEEEKSQSKNSTDQQPNQSQEKPTEGQWIQQAGSLVSSWWNTAKSAEEVQFVRSMAKDVGKDILDLGRSFLEETNELLSQSGAESQGRFRGKSGLLSSQNDQTPWTFYYQQYVNDEHFPEKSVSEWFEEMNGASKLKLLLALSSECQEKILGELADKFKTESNQNTSKKVDDFIEKASSNMMTSSVDDGDSSNLPEKMRENPSGRELQRVFIKARKFSSTLLQIQKEFHDFALKSIDSKPTEFVELLHVTLQMQKHLELEGNRIMAHISSKACSHMHKFADQLVEKQQLTVPYEFKVKESSDEGSLENVLERIRAYVLLVLKEIRTIAREFANSSNHLSHFVSNAHKSLCSTAHDDQEASTSETEIQEMHDEYDAVTRRIPSSFIISGNTASEIVISGLIPFGTAVKFSSLDTTEEAE
uniref:Uncharacterized protein n=1 Tax=Percolomonas cosmopolitus TaxID=63605 RepID=A0A7S1PEN6_9EUKA|mmetsp:Transcript_1645/g.5715  ORF Transcript_1645/g.5715 Transcript_1645/m.5715 type:complete len:598 (+) Transcript_1645:124-1917(+)|eukprot:CAMPEP_0117444574 /NCGR_PEP_ID=MMETSP0759-20121206/5313_1 /TAXON_ID=63605 /ORGANISM="Percolomonas cosmopolitus, Strain WS" /LENGTH=597 /DNA_ID=CAMNT_0005236649 /DNA_START=121 /DNA_END=1914 /DNA_ORIENTATION=+